MGSETKLRTKRSLISEADVYPERMKNKTEWCEAVEKVTDKRHFSQKTQYFFSATQPLSAVFPKHNILSLFLEELLGNLALANA